MRKIALSLLVVAASGAYVWSQSGGAISADPLGSAAAGPISNNDDVQTGSIERRPVQPAVFSVPAVAQIEPAAESGWSGDDEDNSEVERLLAARPADDTPTSPSRPVSITTAALPVTPPAPPAPPSQDAQAEPQTALPLAPETPDLPPAPPAAVEARLPRPRPAYRPTAAVQPVTRVAMKVVSNGRYADGTYTGPVVDAYYGLVQIQAIVQRGQIADIAVLQYPSDRRLSVRINRYALPLLRDEVVSAQSANVDIVSGATLTSEAFIRSLGSALRSAGA
jgi:uncharacterized protein with FMN-binding domain